MQYNNPYIEICLEGPDSLFKGLHQNYKEIIARNHSYKNYRRGDIILAEGTKPCGLICLVSGKVKVFGVGAGGREQIVKMVRQQGFIGYRSLFSDHLYSFSARAVEDSAIVIFNRNSLTKVLKHNPDLTLKFMRVIADELQFIQKRIVSLTQKHVRGRIAESILLLRDTYGVEADGKTIRVSLPREDIAHLSNMTTSNAIRTLSDMASEKIIGIEGRKIMILNYRKLNQISDLG